VSTIKPQTPTSESQYQHPKPNSLTTPFASLQVTGLRSAKQALALFKFHNHHHQQQQQQQEHREVMMVQWHSVDPCDVPAGKQGRALLVLMPFIRSQKQEL